MNESTVRKAGKRAASSRGLTGVRKPRCGQIQECDYVYRDIYGSELFRKIRYKHEPCVCGRGKSFSYGYYPSQDKGDGRYRNLVYQKPLWADWYLYRIEKWWPDLRRGIVPEIYWCEGEKDADALGRLAYATTHHQGAGNANAEQCKWLLKAKRIVIVADLDDAGAYCAASRHDLLVGAGYAGELAIVRARDGNDASDHLAAGYRIGELVPVDVGRLREAAFGFRSNLATNRNKYMEGGSDAA